MIRAGNTFIPVLATMAITLGYISAASGETYYRWTDDRGSPVHSDRPPPKGVAYEVVSTDSRLVRPVEPDKGAVPKKVTPTVSNDFQPMDTRQVLVEKNPEYCQRAKENLNALNTSARIRLRNEEGEYIYIDEEQKAIEKQKALDAIAVNCE